MNFRGILTILFVCLLAFASCGGDETGRSTPIDSTNMNGTAPATYDAENPANYQDTVLQNSNDTGTKVTNGPGSSENTIGGSTNNQAR